MQPQATGGPLPPPPPTPGYAPMPPPRSSNVLLIVVVVVIAVVLAVVGILVAFVLMAPIVSPPPPGGQPPTMALNAAAVGGTTWRIDVMVDRGVALAQFSAALTNETSGAMCIPATTLTPSFSASCSAGVTLRFTDLAGSGQLTSGDYFELSGVTGANSYTLRVIWNATDAVIATELIG